LLVNIEEKPSFSVIGKLGQGFSAEAVQWIPSLWEAANRNFNEIRHLAKVDSSHHIAGIWGIMSDLTEQFNRWTDQGKYLAGCEVEEGAVAPAGWTKWTVPSYRYAVIKCNPSTYQEKFDYMIHDYLPNHDYSIVGAIHEYYDPAETNGDLFLYFPIRNSA